MLPPALMPVFTSSGLNELITTLPPGLLTRVNVVAPPGALRRTAPYGVFVGSSSVTGAGRALWVSIWRPGAAPALGLAVARCRGASALGPGAGTGIHIDTNSASPA